MKLLIKGGALLQMAAETPEDKKLIQQLVMDHMQPPRVRDAEIRMDIRSDGQIGLTSQCGGIPHTFGPVKPQERVLAVELPKLIAELRERSAQLKQLNQK